jgi:hypothetical protein
MYIKVRHSKIVDRYLLQRDLYIHLSHINNGLYYVINCLSNTYTKNAILDLNLNIINCTTNHRDDFNNIIVDLKNIIRQYNISEIYA